MTAPLPHSWRAGSRHPIEKGSFMPLHSNLTEVLKLPMVMMSVRGGISFGVRTSSGPGLAGLRNELGDILKVTW